MRHRLAGMLRNLGRGCFRAADRIQPDAITKALDVAYPPPPYNTQAGATIPVRSPSDDLRWVKPKDDEALAWLAWSDAEIAAELREIRGTLKPWTPERPTTFKRKQRAQR